LLRVVVSPKYSSQGKKTKTLPSSFVAYGVEEVKATISASTSFSQLATANIRPSDQDNLPVYHYYYYFNSILLFIMKSSSSFSLLALLATLYIPTAVVSFVPTYRVLEQQQRPQEPSSRTATAAAARVLQQLHSMQRGRVLSMAQDDDDSGWVAPKSAMIGGAGVNNAGEPPFEIRGFSLGNLVIAAGVLITVASFAEYLSDTDSGLNVSGLGFVYGIPIFLAGAALKYAEIEPVPVYSTQAGEDCFEAKATETIRKIKQDVTRHRYGDEAHLDTTVKKLGLVVPGKDYPQLQELRQEKLDNGELAFTMVWQSIDTPYKMWADERRIKKYETFFGPGVTAEVVKIDAEQRLVGIRLTTIPKGGATAAAAAPVGAAAAESEASSS